MASTYFENLEYETDDEVYLCTGDADADITRWEGGFCCPAGEDVDVTITNLDVETTDGVVIEKDSDIYKEIESWLCDYLAETVEWDTEVCYEPEDDFNDDWEKENEYIL